MGSATHELGVRLGREHRVARPQTRHVIAHRFDDAGGVVAARAAFTAIVAAIDVAPDFGADAERRHARADQDLIPPGLRDRLILELELLRRPTT